MDNEVNASDNKAFKNYFAQEDEQRQFFLEMAENDLNSLKTKYGEKKLIEKIFALNPIYTNFVMYMDFRRQLLVLNFWPRNKPVILNNNQRKQIINLIAGLKPENTIEQIQQWLKEIDQSLLLPSDFQLKVFQKEAYQLYNAYNNLTEILLNNFAHDYLPDTLFCYKKTVGELESISQSIALLTEDFEKEFNRMAKQRTDEANKQAIDKAIDLLKRIGRSQFFLTSEREKANLTHLSDLFVKLDVAIKAAENLKKVNTANQDINALAIIEIKKILKPGIQF